MTASTRTRRSPFAIGSLLCAIVLAATVPVLSVLASTPASAAPATTTSACSTPVAGKVQCFAEIIKQSGFAPMTSTPVGVSPTQMANAYHIPTSASTGSGQTIAIVDAYDDPSIAADFAAFNTQYGLPNCSALNGCFTQVNQTGGTALPTGQDAGWALETSLDVEWAHAMAPGAHILLVEAYTPSFSDMITADSYAEGHAPYVSNSWGGGEFSGQQVSDAALSNPTSTVFAATGDYASAVMYPATSPSVVSVGGTRLYFNANGSFLSESAWSAGGGGCSGLENASSAQSSFSQYAAVGCNGNKATPDVAADADPQSGVPVYDPNYSPGSGGWITVGGTSLATPVVASEAADMGTSFSQNTVYGSSLSFRDITIGSNGHAAGPGYDLATGRGAPLFQAPTTTTLNASISSPTTFGTGFDLTATVSSPSGTPTGQVAFTSTVSGTLCTSTLVSGTATCHLSANALNAGGQNLAASYVANASYAASTSTILTWLVNQAPSSTALTSSINPANSGQATTFTATVSSASGTPDGTVGFSSNGVSISGCSSVSLVGGVAPCTTSFATGPDSVTATYSSLGNYANSASSAVNETILTGTQTTALVSSAPTGSNWGQPVTFTATIVPATNLVGATSGTVTFTSGATALCSNVATDSNGSAACATSVLPVGSEVVQASFTTTNSQMSNSSASVTQQIIPAPTTTTLSPSATSPTVYGTGFTLTATVASASGTPTGHVTFAASNDGTLCSNATVTAGTATCIVPGTTLNTGTQNLTASYAASTPYASSTSTATSWTVNQISTSVVLTDSTTSPVTYGTSSILTATVTSAVGNPTGTVAFSTGPTDYNAPICQLVPVANGTASCTLNQYALWPKQYLLLATFYGTGNYADSPLTNLSWQVNPASSTTTVTASPNPALSGQPTTLTAAVSSAVNALNPPIGLMSFTDNGTAISGCTNLQTRSGHVSCPDTFASSTPSNSIVASFTDTDTDYRNSSGSMTELVDVIPTAVTVTPDANPIAHSANLLVTASVSSNGYTMASPGQVSFFLDASPVSSCSNQSPVNGVSSCSLPILSIGQHVILATFTPTDPNFTSAVSTSLNQVVSATATVPGAPTIGSVTGGAGAATITWATPIYDGGAPINGYTITPYIGTTAQTPQVFNSTATTQTVSGLTNGITYTFAVAASNSVGTGANSTPSDAVMPSTTPGAPTIGFAIGGNANATVTWTAPTLNGGSPIFGYTVTPHIGSTAQTPQVFNSVATVQVISGLTDGTAYTFTVSAVNTNGTGASSSATNQVTPNVTPVTPSAPTAVPGSGSVSLTWASVLHASSYNVYATPAGGSRSIVTVGVTQTGYNVTNLSNGTAYTFDITAANNAGTSAASPQSNAVTPSNRLASDGGYWLVASDGGIFSFGDAQFYGSTGAIHLNRPIVGMASTPDNKGYWLVASDGGIFNYGDATFYGSTGAIRLTQPVVGMATTPDGRGYWLVASDGGIFAFGDAAFYGSTGNIRLAKPIVGMTTTPDGKGYWLVASDGGVFSFGDAQFHGSAAPNNLGNTVVGITTTADGGGYWIATSTGRVFNFGNAASDGSISGSLARPIVLISGTTDGKGYWLVASDGGVFSFGDAAFHGSTGNITLNKPIVGMSAS